MSRVIDDYLLTNVDKVVAVNLYQAGFDIVGVRECGDIDWMLSPVYDEEIGDDVNLEPEEAIQKIMEYEGEVFLASYIPISFVEVKGTENVIKTRFSVGDMVYALIPDSSASFSPSKIKHLKIVGIKYQESYTNAELNTIEGSRKTDLELYVKGIKSVKTTKYYLADSNSTYARGYMMYEDELFNSVEELKESL